MTGSGVRKCALKASQLNPLKILNQLIFFFLFTFLIKGRLAFVCFDDRELSTSEIAICSLSSHHILTPNELICLTPVAIRRSVVY